MHRHLGPGLLESTYEHCLCHELSLRGLSFERPLPLIYKGAHLERGDRLDVTLGGEQRRRHRGGNRRHAARSPRHPRRSSPSFDREPSCYGLEPSSYGLGPSSSGREPPSSMV
ncbi:GxxExxY protein [Sorangium sp. So ce590]|uniref:GxxExxY protein n=1 Tax=Sorangium sp. So ce590 TaxID=3133317 RepID=UPI003F5ED7FC